MENYCQKADSPNYPLHHFDTPFRFIVVAPSGSGKSNFITNLIA
jgi:guanylate kinase